MEKRRTRTNYPTTICHMDAASPAIRRGNGVLLRGRFPRRAIQRAANKCAPACSISRVDRYRLPLYEDIEPGSATQGVLAARFCPCISAHGLQESEQRMDRGSIPAHISLAGERRSVPERRQCRSDWTARPHPGAVGLLRPARPCQLLPPKLRKAAEMGPSRRKRT